MRFHVHPPVEQMKDNCTNKNDGIAGDHEHRKPGGKSPILRIFTPVADAKGDDSAEKQAFVGDRVEDDA